MFLYRHTVRKILRTWNLSKGNHGKKYMDIICSFLPELFFKTGEEVDILDEQNMWCPVYILYIDKEYKKVFVTHKFFPPNHDQWVHYSNIMHRNSMRYKQGDVPMENQMVKFTKNIYDRRHRNNIEKILLRTQTFIGRILNNTTIIYTDYYFKIKKVYIDEVNIYEMSRNDNYINYKKEYVQEKVKEYSEGDVSRIRTNPSKKYMIKKI